MIVKYRRLYPYAPYLNEEIGFEITIPDDGDPIAEVETLKSLCDEAHKKLNPNFAPLTDFNTGQPEAPIDPHAVLRLQQLINGATTPEELETYYPDAEKYGLTGTWDKKLKSLKE